MGKRNKEGAVQANVVEKLGRNGSRLLRIVKISIITRALRPVPGERVEVETDI